MAKDDKTEKPTGKRRRESRKQGQVAKSQELSGALVVLAGLFAVSAMASTVVTGTGNAMQSILMRISNPSDVSSAAGLHDLFGVVEHTILTTVVPIAAVCVAVGILANVAQVGLKPSLTALKPNFKRINPVSGAKNLFGTRLLFETGKSLAKVTFVGAIAAAALIPQIKHLGASVGTSPSALGHLMGSSVMAIAQRAAFAYLLIAIVDLIWQRRRHEKSLKMTKQEVKDEAKQYNAPGEVKAAQKRRAMQLARARMMAAVPQADVVVTNPTHYAVALSYDGSRPAPVVVAKGKGFIALQIRRIAEEHGVTIVPDPPLARSLHASVETDHMIPEEFYAAVAQLLAFVYRMAARRRVA